MKKVLQFILDGSILISSLMRGIGMMLHSIHSFTFSFNWARFMEAGYFAVEKKQV